ncbi:MAG: hypothetical protein ACRDSJ_03025 [Rubrobacteraceae bacterium]
MGLRDRLARLEGRTGERPGEARFANEEIERKFLAAREDACKDGLESMAHDLAAGCEPDLTYANDGAFYTQLGRLALSPTFQDLQALCGREAEEHIESVPADRWERFLDSDEHAAELLDKLKGRAGAGVPDGYRTWLEEREREIGELHKREGLEEDGLTPPEVCEEARRLAWVLIHDPEAPDLLAELLARRDEFASAG